MPTVSIHYSKNMSGIDFRSALTQIHSLLVEHCDAKLKACKGRAECADAFVIGDGTDSTQAFVIIHIALLSGRTTEQKQRLCESLSDLAREFKASDLNCQVRLKLEDLARDEQYFFLAN